MFGEHIEEMIKLFKENETPLVPADIANEVLGIAYAQGLLDEKGCEEAFEGVKAEVEYMLHPGEAA